MTKEEFLKSLDRLPPKVAIAIAKKIFSGQDLKEILEKIKG